MHADSFVDNVNHWQGLVVVLSMVKPIHISRKAVFRRQVLQPTRILGTPNQCVELISKVVLLGIVESIVCSTPVEIATGAFYR